MDIEYQRMIARLIRSSNINLLDAIVYSNIITNKDRQWSPDVINRVKGKIEDLYFKLIK